MLFFHLMHVQISKDATVSRVARHDCMCVLGFRMWGNTIGDEGAEAFAEALKNHTSLTNLR